MKWLQLSACSLRLHTIPSGRGLGSAISAFFAPGGGGISTFPKRAVRFGVKLSGSFGRLPGSSSLDLSVLSPALSGSFRRFPALETCQSAQTPGSSTQLKRAQNKSNQLPQTEA